MRLINADKYMAHLRANIDTTDACEMAIKALEQEPRWIPITERLPNKSGRYLVSYDSGYVAMALYYESVSKWGATTTERIVAWMPLPEPYNAESGEK